MDTNDEKQSFEAIEQCFEKIRSNLEKPGERYVFLREFVERMDEHLQKWPNDRSLKILVFKAYHSLVRDLVLHRK